MSPTEHNERQAWWERGKRLVLLTQIGQTLFVVGSLLYGTYVIVRNEATEILSNPKKTAAVARRVDSAFAAYDTLHSKQSFVTAPANRQSILTSKGF